MLPRGTAALLRLRHELNGRDRIINVSGEVDVYTSPLLQAALNSARDAARIIVDLTDCQYVDASGLSLLVRAHRRSGDRLFLIVSSGVVEKMLRITGLYERLQIFSSRHSLEVAVSVSPSRVDLRSGTAT